VRDETLPGDRVITALYSPVLENAPWLVRVASSRHFSKTLAYLSYDNLLSRRGGGTRQLLIDRGINLDECVEPLERLDTPRKLFERQIRYWECRPMPPDPAIVVCPADARLLVGSLDDSATLFIKEKFFDFEELLGVNEHAWLRAFRGGDFAVFRLTPEKYHYTHLPVDGVVEDVYEIAGGYHSCNPTALISGLDCHSKNRRLVTIIQTDVEHGSDAGLVAMVEVVALMVGQIVACYSHDRYESPGEMTRGLFVKRGQPKSLFRPGSSTVILFFQKGRMRFCEDLTRNRFRQDAQSRFSFGFDRTIVETDVAVRSPLGFGVR